MVNGDGASGVPPKSPRFFCERSSGEAITKPEDVRRCLKHADHWRKDYSAYELAHSWVGANDIPASVLAVLSTCPDYAGAALVEGLFERPVALRTPGGPSWTDLLTSSSPTAATL